MQGAQDVAQELARLLYTSSSSEQVFTWLVPTDDVLDDAQFSQDALASGGASGSLVRSNDSCTDVSSAVERIRAVYRLSTFGAGGSVSSTLLAGLTGVATSPRACGSAYLCELVILALGTDINSLYSGLCL